MSSKEAGALESERRPAGSHGVATNKAAPRTTMVQSSPAKPPYPSYNYTSTGVRDRNIANLPSQDWQIIGVLTVLAFMVRLFRIYQPTSVVFDEVHFGGFASKYIKGKFFMDVHPPLAKLLITLAGWLAGFDGEFDFKSIGKDYLEPNVPYVAMRMLPAICGVLAVPAMFLALKTAGCRTFTASLGALLITFENGLVTQSRFILLDSPLVIFTAMTAVSWMNFTNQNELGPTNAFKPAWWFWLAFTGVCLGATVSVKWVGLFTIAWVGSLTALQLWVLLGDTRNVTARIWLKHLFARMFCLIVVPIAFYLAMFAIHFLCLVNPGDGDGFMSSEFQSTLNTKGMTDVPADVAFGSRVSFRHHNTQGGYLHSHLHMYPGGSKQQQITLYPHKDENNLWLLENTTQPIDWASDPTGNTTFPGPLAWDLLDSPQYISDGDTIRLYHITTDRRLHSHDVRPPVTEADWQNEVTAYGYEGFEGDANDLFRVEIVKSMSDGAVAKERVRTIETKFKLVHIMTGCVLFSHKVKLPDWGFEQQEVTCAKGGTLPNSIWYVEQNAHPKLAEDAEKVNYKNPGFFGKFWELQQVMWTTNAGLVESHAWDSRPPSWPVLSRGINFWGENYKQIYLLGNPIIWWSSTAAIALYVAFKGLAVLRWQRSCNDYSSDVFKRFDYEIGMTVLGWAFHYFPFYLMQRQLFLHHYFPALFFAIMAFCQVYDFVVYRVAKFGEGRFSVDGIKDLPMLGRIVGVVFLFLCLIAFATYSPLVYGNQWTSVECKRWKFFEKWDFDCNAFPEKYEQYAKWTVSANSDVVSTSKKEKGVFTPLESDVSSDGAITPAFYIPDDDDNTVTEEQIEYRDEEGNLLDEEQVKALEGKVSFSTRYETRTRLVDQHGNEISNELVGEGEGEDNGNSKDVAGTSADGPDPGTSNPKGQDQASPSPPKVNANDDMIKEKIRAEDAAAGTPQPEGDAVKQTGRDEL